MSDNSMEKEEENMKHRIFMVSFKIILRKVGNLLIDEAVLCKVNVALNSIPNNIMDI